MTTSNSMKCPQCGGELPVNFAPGVCPTCLLKQGMSPSTLTGSAGDANRASDAGQRHRWTPPAPADLADKFPQLEIVELLGQGGMGAVYKVRQKELDRWAALKILSDEVASDPNFAERFQREARALAQLSHQHIVVVYEFGRRDGVYFLLMEYVDGVTLRQASRAGQVTTKDALSIVTQICDALQFAHEEGVVHRDIKPENILIDKRGRVKIADFGLAKLLGKPANIPSLTGTHQVMGTPLYMAPEQLEGTKGVDHRADIFSLGVVFYELLTGELPLGRFAPPSQKYSLDVRLDEVVLRTLEKEPDRRYQQASEVKCDVETIRSQPIAAKSVKGQKATKPWTPMQTAFAALMIIGLGTFAGLVGCVVFISWLDTRTKPGSAASVAVPTDRLAIAEQKRAANAMFTAELDRQHLEKHQLEEATRDPNEVNAIVRFTSDGVKLHPQFGTNEFNVDQRQAVERIMTSTHKQYLACESRVTTRRTGSDGSQIITISNSASEVLALENDFWTAIDAAVPVSQQKFLRLNLPLYADASRNLPLVADSSHTPMGSAGGGPAWPSAVPGTPGVLSAGGMGGMGTPSGPAPFNIPANLLYPQLLGWKQNQLPLSFTIGRRGKWFTWSIKARGDENRLSSEEVWIAAARELAEGEVPELPSGLRRLWQEGLNPAKQVPESVRYPARSEFSDRLSDIEKRESLLRTSDGLQLSDKAATAAQLQGDQLRQVNQILSDIHREYLQIEARLTESNITEHGHVQIEIPAIPKEQSELESELWTRIDALVSDEKQQASLRANLPLFAGWEDTRFTDLSLIGWRASAEPGWSNSVFVEIWRKGTWFHWTIGRGKATEEGDGARLPPELIRFWREPESLKQSAGDLTQQLLELDKLRAADKTPWDEVEKRTNELLAKYTAPEDKGRIHWQAAHVYGQSDIRGHAADVIRHAKEALKYERDPKQRGWLFMYLGCASEVLDSEPKNFVTRRAEASCWYLKGYAELLPFHLPDKAPELPPIHKIEANLLSGADADIDAEQTAAAVRQAAQLKVRKEAELTRELVQHRDVYISRLADLYGRMHTLYDKDSDAKAALRALATETLQDEAIANPSIVDELLGRVFPPGAGTGSAPK